MDPSTLDVVKKSDSAIIILIVVIVAAIIALRPIIKMWIESKEKQYKNEVEQRDKILSVIQANTEVNASLKTILEEDRTHCDDCKREQHAFLRQIQDNQDVANMKIIEIHTLLKDKKEAVM